LSGDGAVASPESVASVAKTSVPAPQKRQERRSQRRAGVKLAARVRPVDPSNGNFCDVLYTVNASRKGLYVVTTNEYYQKGMRVRVTFPYDSAHDSVTASEENGEVTRIERLDDGRIGVAIQLPGAGRSAGSERRIASRRPVSAAAVVVDTHASLRLEARCSDLSMQGCYVDTLNPFPLGTDSHIELQMDGAVVATRARVNCSHAGMGMGLSFQELTPDQKSVLSKWLTNERVERQWTGRASEIVKQAESLDRTAAIELIQILLSKGILSKTDLANLVPAPIII
jgi:PilZ domain